MVDKKYLKEIYSIHPKLFSKIRKAGTKTGSKVFGGWKEGSDIDFIMPPGFEPSFDEAIKSKVAAPGGSLIQEEESKTFKSAYMKTEQGTIINLLWMQTEEAYRIWTEATEILKTLVEKYPAIAEKMRNEKDTRVQS